MTSPRLPEPAPTLGLAVLPADAGGSAPMEALVADHASLADGLARGSAGGKGLRPWLVAAVHDALGGGADGAVEAVGRAVELLHTAFVVHDDVIDGDDLRRGQPSVPGWFETEATAAGSRPDGARTYALAGAILTGDLALAGALRTVALCPATPDVTRRLLDLFDAALRSSAAGELADVRLSLGIAEPSLDEVIAMEEHKTAVYSFELPMQCGAVLAGVGPAVVGGVGEVGRRLGVAYQLLDDVHGVFGDERHTGKSALGDLREGKRTPLVVHARTSSTWAEIAPHLGDPTLTPERAATVRRALEAGGSRAFVESLAADYVHAALAQATELGLPGGFLDRIDWISQQLGAA